MRATANDGPAPARLGLLLLLIAGIASLFAFHILRTVKPFGSIRLSPYNRSFFRVVLPQGWEFFTRDPHDERAEVYALSASGRWVTLIPSGFGRSSNDLGISRAHLARQTELALLSRQAPETDWIECQGTTGQCLDSLREATDIRSASVPASLCGDLAIIIRKPVPWAQAVRGVEVLMPARAARLRVRC